MCGIAGFWVNQKESISAEQMDVVGKSMTHRGPDDEGYLTWSEKRGIHKAEKPIDIVPGEIGLIHRRLSILDLSKQGWQPMSSADNRYHIVFNGEIYNFLELKEQLLAKGLVFYSESDTEVLLNAYILWGEQCVLKFVGMFAFCIFDQVKNTFFCARDHFGIKPFYYAYHENCFYFASEIKTILKFFKKSPTINAKIAYGYLKYGYQEKEGETFFQDIYEIPPASYFYFSIQEGNPPKPHVYWRINRDKKSTLTFLEASEKLNHLFMNSMRLHLRSDVPMAATLSGGIDSSSIVMAMRSILGDEPKIQTISFISDHSYLSEETWVDLVNEKAGAVSSKTEPTSHDLISELNELIYIQEQPFGSSSIFAQYQVCKVIKELNYKVVLDGQGADELLAGYRSYLYSRMRTMLSKKKYIDFIRLFFNALLLPGVFRQFFSLLKGYLSRKVHVFLPQKKNKSVNEMTVMNQKWFDSRNIHFSTESIYPTTTERMKDQLLETLTRLSLPPLLKVQDKNAMAFSIESRVPFLTPEIAEFIFSLPEEFIIDNHAVTKAVFRKAMEGLVPAEILKRKDKIGFSTPEKEWLTSKKEWVESVFSSEMAKKIPFINAGEMLSEWHKLLNNETTFCWRFWRWLNFILWAEKFNVQFN